MAAYVPEPGGDLGRVVEPDCCGLPQLPPSPSSGASHIPIRPCPSAGALAPEAAMFTTSHTIPLGSHGLNVVPCHGWSDHLPDQAKAGLPAISGFDLRTEMPEDCAMDADRIRAFVVYTLQHHVAHAGKQILENNQLASVQGLLHEYCDAIRDLDYMRDKVSRKHGKELFNIRPSELAESDASQKIGIVPRCESTSLPSLFPQELAAQRLPTTFTNFEPRLKRVQRGIWRFVYALYGGLTLLLPALVMTLAGGRLCALITTSTCIVLFAALMTWESAFTLDVVFTIAMAYSAALVIFMSGRV